MTLFFIIIAVSCEYLKLISTCFPFFFKILYLSLRTYDFARFALYPTYKTDAEIERRRIPMMEILTAISFHSIGYYPINREKYL